MPLEAPGTPSPRDDEDEQTTASPGATGAPPSADHAQRATLAGDPTLPEDQAPPDDQDDPDRPAPPPVSWKGLSPEDRARLLDEADPEELRSHRRVQGITGRLYQQRVQDLQPEDLPPTVRQRIEEATRARLEQEAQERELAALGQSGEFYTLGQKAFEDMQNRRGQEIRTRRAAEQKSAVTQEFAARTRQWAIDNFPTEVLDAAAHELNEGGKMDTLDFEGQYNLWLKTVTTHNARHEARQEKQRWEKEELPAHRQRWLAEQNGTEPSPETESNGAPAGQRILTDEAIDRMSLKEFEAVWDMERNEPKKGYRWRPTRSLDTRQIAMGGGR